MVYTNHYMNITCKNTVNRGFRNFIIRRITVKHSFSNIRDMSSQGSGDSTLVNSIKGKLSFLSTSFKFRRGEIEILNDPSCFYNTLKQKISNAQDRVFLATLYIGKTEDELISCVGDALENNPKLKVYFLLDGIRGTRESPSNCSAQLLAKLAKSHSDRVQIRLYQTPSYIGWKKALIPNRFNEGLGLQHMKIYGVDDEVILSGANLSDDYFTNRQDRYFIFKSKSFSNYYFKLHQLISSLSYKLEYSNNKQQYQLFWPKSNIAIEPIKSKRIFINQSSLALEKLLKESYNNNIEEENSVEYPTTVYPVSQFTPLFHKFNDKSTEKKSILNMISSISSPSINWVFTTGYFNMLPDIRKKLLATPSQKSTVITASPYANGFYESKGVSSHLPAAYLHLSKKFLKAVKRNGKENNIQLREWKRGIVNKPDGWSYHAKGLWILGNDNGESLPFATVIGSSNYTKRAYSLDLETNAVILTTDIELKKQLNHELENLLGNTEAVSLKDFKSDPNRKVSIGVKVATTVLGTKL